ncbi:MAG TPA: hypothetical protein VFJ53_02620 [Solirubrobacterales bacterium]|nr:hypothetical protein [Solirubrobacterales bacterium]
MRASVKALLVLAALLLLPAASANADTIKGGNVHLKLNGALARQLKEEGVRLIGLKPAHAGHVAVTLPISSGGIENRYGSGYLYLSGGFKLQAGKGSVTVRRLLLNTSERFLTGVVNGTAVKLASLPPQRTTIGIFNTATTLKSLKLTPKAVAAFNRSLGLHGVFKAGRSLGVATARVDFQSLSVRSGQLGLAIDNAFREKLQAVEATISSTSISAPIQTGELDRDLAGGLLFSEATFQITQKDEPFDYAIGFLTLTLDLGTHTLSGAVNVDSKEPRLPFSGPVATLPPFPAAEPFSKQPVSPLIPFNPENGEASASGLAATLSPELAKLMNEVFGAPKGKPDYFSPGEPFGAVSFTALTR